MKTIYLAGIRLLVGLSITQNVFAAAAQEAAAQKNVENQLLSAYDEHITPEQQILGTQLIDAVIDSNGDKITDLIAQGAPLNFRDAIGRIPLQMAVNNISLHRALKKESTAEEKILDILLAAHADVNRTNGKGLTPLMWASKSNENHDIIKTLLAAGAHASINQQSHSGPRPRTTALMDAVLYPDTVKLLLEAGAGASINYKDKYKETALVHAIYHKCAETVRLLILAGADVDTVTDMWGKSVWTMQLYKDDRQRTQRAWMTEIIKRSLEEKNAILYAHKEKKEKND